MSPASQGSLEVEHYIGSSLISSSARVNHSRGAKARKPEGPGKGGKARCGEHGLRHPGYPVPPGMVPLCGCASGYFPPRPGQYPCPGGPPGWTPMPLVPLPKNSKKCPGNKGQQFHKGGGSDDASFRTPLSRLAIHTQGAPLILAGRCAAGPGRKTVARGGPARTPRPDLVTKRTNKYKDSPMGQSATSDCLSVASDESSGSGHSENCLPRIIKPRKRRKKDRKPPSESPAGEEALEPLEPPAETCDRKPNVPVGGTISKGSQREETAEEEHLGPRLHHSFEEVAESDGALPACSPSSCQCRYCDPSGIWDAPSGSFLGSPVFPDPPPLALRRSWSEPTQTHQPYPLWKRDYQPETARSNSFGEADSWRVKSWASEQWESLKGCDITPARGETTGDNPCLQVSTEIVTSPNGHRDLEIRFFSASPPA